MDRTGGIGAFHLLARNVGLIRALDEHLDLLKQHKPYHESDHVLNIAYNTLSGGTCPDDIELRRGDEAYMDALGAEPIPDPTTAGDFTRRFSDSDVVALMEALGAIRVKLWRKRLSRSERAVALVRQAFRGLCLRGDPDFALTRHFDQWTEDGIRFAFGLDAMASQSAH